MHWVWQIVEILVIGKIAFYIAYRAIVGPQTTLWKVIRVTYEWPTLRSIGLGILIAELTKGLPWEWARVAMDAIAFLIAAAGFVGHAVEVLETSWSRATIGFVAGAVLFTIGYFAFVFYPAARSAEVAVLALRLP